ncbi:exodeoxyribonuclease VII large subunit [Thalassobaculum salexigens]|uniref:exodeoxyribonuclease VII large subunit n=1 Tax=Thalassobaculum salexigens TaxID=455360 RepID=UPI00248EA592|nr:exodeoxyribonuclease VII large subunit [Thalassobaculum salexigens]
MRYVLTLLSAVVMLGLALPAQAAPLRIEITEGVIEPLPYAVPNFVAENSSATRVANDLARVVAEDLSGTGLFREIPAKAHISKITSFSSPVQFADWKAINAQALITGTVIAQGGQLTVQFRVYDVFSGAELGTGLQFSGPADGWRRMAHKVADAVYSRITGEGGYFDSRVVYVSETGPKDDRRKRLAAEGLFDAERKRPIPFLPTVIGVVTSPTGAVIRDILHRLADRFPVHVIVWPVLVQGDGAKDQVSRAIRGFNSLPEQGGPMPRPDLLIVARGGGSLEDLWAFNEEEVVRAAAASDIPLISAVGHETDTTLIDFASDRRAPTPSAAAEMAVPVRADLIARLAEDTARLTGAVSRRLNEGRTVVSGLARGLGDPGARIEQAQQRLDYASGTSRSRITALLDRLKYAVDRPIPSPAEILARTRGRFDTVARGLRVGPIERSIADGDRDLARLLRGARSAYGRRLKSEEDRLAGLGKLLDANSFERVLERGFALVRDESGAPVKSAAETSAGQTVSLRFRDGETSAVIGTGPAPADGGGGAKPKARAKPAPASPPDTPTQETLF